MSDGVLLPCPFCGSNDLFHEFSNAPWRYVGCNQCEQEGPPAESLDEAVRLWNTRHITLEQAKKVVEEAGMVCVPVESPDIVKDAARYQYLRTSEHYGGRQSHCLKWYLPRYNEYGLSLRDALDRCIDEAIERRDM